jgi:hypothetical protein
MSVKGTLTVKGCIKCTKDVISYCPDLASKESVFSIDSDLTIEGDLIVDGEVRCSGDTFEFSAGGLITKEEFELLKAN